MANFAIPAESEWFYDNMIEGIMWQGSLQEIYGRENLVSNNLAADVRT